jgi:hypothetical protein
VVFKFINSLGGISSANGESTMEKRAKKQSLFLEVLGTIVMVVLGLAVYRATGLYAAADSGIVQVALGGSIAYWFALNFRVALNGK